MRWSIAWTILRKELLETVRDRRTLVVMLVLPMVLYPLLIIAFGQVVTHHMSQIQEVPGRVLVNGELPTDLQRYLSDEAGLELLSADDAPPPPMAIELVPREADEPSIAPRLPETRIDERYQEWARNALDDEAADVAIVVGLRFVETLDSGGMAPILIYYDETRQKSQTVRQDVVQLLTHYRLILQQERVLAQQDLPEGFSNPLLIEWKNTATAKKRGGFLAGRIIPLVLMVMVMLGAFYPAIDLTAGEKERGTMQTLLTAPAQPLEIVLGKFGTVFTVAMVSAMVNLLSMALAIGWMLRSMPAGTDFVFKIDFATVLIVLIQLIPIAVFFSAVMLAIAVFAQSFKEAQNYLTPVYMLVIVPAGIAMLPAISLEPVTAWIPGLNIMLLMRELMVEPPGLELIFMVLLANGVFAALALTIAVHVFQSEQVLLGGHLAVNDVLQLRTDGGQPRANPMLSIAAFAFVLLLIFYLGSWMQETSIFWGMLGTQYLLLLLPALLIPKLLTLPIGETMQLGLPSWRGWLGALLIGATGWAIIGHSSFWLQGKLLPMPEGFQEQMADLLGLASGELAIWQIVFAFAISPAICEEFFFRGLIMGGFRRKLGKWPTIVITGLLFGIFHISIYRIFPTAMLGIVIAWVAYESRSIWPSILLHFLNNFIALMATTYGWLPGLAEIDESGVNWVMVAVAAAMFIAGVLLIPRRPPQNTTS